MDHRPIAQDEEVTRVLSFEISMKHRDWKKKRGRLMNEICEHLNKYFQDAELSGDIKGYLIKDKVAGTWLTGIPKPVNKTDDDKTEDDKP